MISQGICLFSAFVFTAIAIPCACPPEVSSVYDEVHLTKKIKFFNSSCTSYDGSLLINDKSGFTHKELVTLFGKLKSFFGTLHIYEVKFETIEFLDKVEQIGFPGISRDINLWIWNTTIRSISLTNLKNLTGVSIGNNPNLNLSANCDKLFELLYNNREIIGNLDNCGCAFMNWVTIDHETIYSLPSNCTKMFMGLEFHNQDFTKEVTTDKFAQVEHIYGNLYFSGIRQEVLDFFPKLKSIDFLQIAQNRYLLQLDFPNLETIGIVDIKGNTEEFCLPTTFIEKNSKEGSTLEVAPCTHEGSMEENTCVYNGSLLELPDDCRIIIGYLSFQNRTLSEEELAKLKPMKKLFGFLRFVRTSITNLSFLSNLEAIYTTLTQNYCDVHSCFHEDGSPLVLLQNENLTELIIPNLKTVFDMSAQGIYMNITETNEAEVCTFYKKTIERIRYANLDECSYKYSPDYVEWIP